ncbi:general substrate transporter [Thozetella sp. PMI_491]|nr:general substrate transporter [Thozetella sp. PMI_491]
MGLLSRTRAWLRQLPFLRHFTLVSFVSVMVLNISVMEFGFDNAIMSLAQAMEPFDIDFDMYPAETPHVNGTGKGHHHHKELDPVKLSYLSALGLPVRAVLLFVALFLGERFGRWIVFFAMQIGCLVGAALLFSAKTFTQVLIGRITIQVFVGWHDWLIPMYMAELVPAPVRGVAISSYVAANYMGSFSASAVSYGCSRAFNDSRQYRIPFGLMFLFPAVSILLAWFMPESPRWLVRKGRLEDAVKALRKLNGSRVGYSPEEEASLLQQSVEADDKTQGRWSDLRRGTNKRRTLVAIGCIILVQCTGQAFVTKYGTIFVKGLGIMDPILFGLIERALGFIAPVFMMLTVDRFGRRPIFFFTAAPYVICLYVIGGLGIVGTVPALYGVIVLYVVAAISHIISFHGVCLMVAAEVPHLTLRDKTLLVSYLLSFVFEFAVSFSLPYLLYAPYADLQSKVGFVYGSVALLAVIWAWFCLPETRRRSLEELEELWAAKVPAWRFAKYTTTGDIGLRISQLERHAGHGDISDMSQEELKDVTVYHEEVVVEKGKA